MLMHTPGCLSRTVLLHFMLCTLSSAMCAVYKVIATGIDSLSMLPVQICSGVSQLLACIKPCLALLLQLSLETPLGQASQHPLPP